MSQKSIDAVRAREAGKRTPVVPAGATKKQAKKFEALDESLAAEQSEVNAKAKAKPEAKSE